MEKVPLSRHTVADGIRWELKLTLFASAIYFLAIIFNVSPYLRGPAPYPPEWQWGYQFLPNPNKLWVPLTVIIVIFIYANYLQNISEEIKKYEKRILSILLLLFFFFQISLLYYSKGGINVIFFKIANPGYNGYFTASLQIKNLQSFLKDYDKNVLSYSQHARGHPPGTILLAYTVNHIALYIPQLKQKINAIHPKRNDINALWQQLAWNEKLGSLALWPIISLFSLTGLVPIYYLGKILGDVRVGLRAALLYGFIPSVSLFIPLPDALYAVFGVFATYLFVRAIRKKRLSFFFISGLILSIGTFFSLSLLPIIFMLFLLSLLTYVIEKRGTREELFIQMLFFFGGIALLPFLLLLLFQYNSIAVNNVILKGLAPRSYFLWLFFNPYDFFMFAGVPTFIAFLLFLKTQIRYISKGLLGKLNILFISFVITVMVTNVIGNSRAEVGRIWLPFVPFLVVLSSQFLTQNLNFTKNQYLIVLLIQVVQVVIFESFLILYG